MITKTKFESRLDLEGQNDAARPGVQALYDGGTGGPYP